MTMKASIKDVVRRGHLGALSAVVLGAVVVTVLPGCGDSNIFVLQPLASKQSTITIEDSGEKAAYIPSTTETIKWGRLPNATDVPLVTITS